MSGPFPIQTRSLADIEANAPRCKICDAPIARAADERPAKWRRRQSCCPAHARMLQARRQSETKTGASLKEYAHAPCVSCGGSVTQREGEKPADWKRRQTCSPDCRNDWRRTVAKRELPANRRKPRREPKRSPFARKHIPATGFETVAEALARGVKIKRIEPPDFPPSGVPVRSKIGFSTGRI